MSPHVFSCSLKTAENLACVASLPLSSLLLESDSPYCEIRPSHASYPFLASLPSHLAALYLPKSVKKEKWRAGDFTVKGRNEPILTGAVAWVVARVKEVAFEHVAETVSHGHSESSGSFD